MAAIVVANKAFLRIGLKLFSFLSLLTVTIVLTFKLLLTNTVHFV